MIRTQILLDEPTYRALRRRAHEKGSSVSALARAILGQGFEPFKHHGESHARKGFFLTRMGGQLQPGPC
jgi:plasmid stability protein